MANKRSHGHLEMMQGALDLIILRTLRWGPMHGHGIAGALWSAARV